MINFVKSDKKRFNVDVNKENDAMQMDVDDENAVQDQLLKDEHEHMFNERQI